LRHLSNETETKSKSNTKTSLIDRTHKCDATQTEMCDIG